MATIQNLKSRDELVAFLETLDEGGLLGQQITQKGAIHALEFLLTEGCTEDVVKAMLESLRANMEVIEAVAHRKGWRRLFERDAH